MVVGDYESAKEKYLGFVYSDGTYATINVPGSTATYVERINASGEVTGYYVKDSTDFGFIATPQSAPINMMPSAVAAAPEPSTWALMLSGFAALSNPGHILQRVKTSVRWLRPSQGDSCLGPFLRIFVTHCAAQLPFHGPSRR